MCLRGCAVWFLCAMVNCLWAALAVRLKCVLSVKMFMSGGWFCSAHRDLKMRLYSWVLGIQEGRRYKPLLGV